MEELQKKLYKIQQELKAPKNQYNSFGKYKYRNCEDILEAVKPLLDGLTLIISDEIVNLGDRFYVKSIVRLANGNAFVETTAFARESLIKKGMDESQITGAASSYARKYALNGLFAIDDTKDSDNQDNTKQDNTKKETPQSVVNNEKAKLISKEIERLEPELEKPLYKKMIFEKTGIEVIPENYNKILNKLKTL